jgi:hypothetical protein
LLARGCEPSCRRSSVDAAALSEPSRELLSDDWVGTTAILSDRSLFTPSLLPSRPSGFVQSASKEDKGDADTTMCMRCRAWRSRRTTWSRVWSCRAASCAGRSCTGTSLQIARARGYDAPSTLAVMALRAPRRYRAHEAVHPGGDEPPRLGHDAERAAEPAGRRGRAIRRLSGFSRS